MKIQQQQKVKCCNLIILILSFIVIQFVYKPRNRQNIIQYYEQQYSEQLKSEYDWFKDIIFEEDSDEQMQNTDLDQDQNNKNNYIFNDNDSLQKLLEFCSYRQIIQPNVTQIDQNLQVYFDWDDQFNDIQSLFNTKQPNDNLSQQDSSEQADYYIRVKGGLNLQRIDEVSNKTDIIFTQSNKIKGRFDLISSSLCYNQVFNHIPGSSLLYGKLNLIELQKITTKKYRSNLKCLLEIDFYPKIFDLRNDCTSFEEYINIGHLQNDKQVFYIAIQGSYKRNYNILSLTAASDQNQLANNNNTFFNCFTFWNRNMHLINQPYLVQEVSMKYKEEKKKNNDENKNNNTDESKKNKDENKKNKDESNRLSENFDMYFLRVNFMISSTKPLIAYCQNQDLVYYKSNKRIKSSEFFKQFPSLNEEIIFKIIFKSLSHTILSSKSYLLEDSRLFELFTADFSVQQKQIIQLFEIYPFTTIYKYQEMGYDLQQKRFLKESLFIISQQFANKINKFQEIMNKNILNPEEDILHLLNQKDKNDGTYLTSNFIEVIINENLQRQEAYKYLSPSCTQ